MKRDMSSAASSSFAKAQRVAAVSSSFASAVQPGALVGSAERPVSLCFFKIDSMENLLRWMAKQPIESCNSADMQRIREAAEVLSTLKPSQCDIRSLQPKWQVLRERCKKERPLQEVVCELRRKVIRAAKAVQLEDVRRLLADETLVSLTEENRSRIAEAVAVLDRKLLCWTSELVAVIRKWNIRSCKDAKGNKRRAVEEVLCELEGKVFIAVQEIANKFDSAAEPVAEAGGPAELENLTECKKWLQALPSQEILQSKPLQRLQEVVDLVQRPSSRKQRQEVFKLCDDWDVVQKVRQRKRKYEETKAELVAKAVQEMRRLKQMRREVEESTLGGSDTKIGGRFSAIGAVLDQGS